jgi:hypothetical protein
VVWAALLMGRAVIPLDDRKKPFVKWKRCQTDPPTIDQVLAWQYRFRPPAWAVVTVRRYRFLVLDFDGKRGRETMERLGLQPHLRTGSGGHHVHLAYPDDLDVRTWNGKAAPFLDAILPGVDTKGNGGYAVFAGTSSKGAYHWLRPMWPDLCTPQLHDLLTQVLTARSRSAKTKSNVKRPRTPSSNLRAVSEEGTNGSRVPAKTLLKWALARATKGRNAAGFELSCQARDNGYTQSEAEALLAEYAGSVGPYDQHGEQQPYTESEALASVAQAYSEPPRQPWTLPTAAGDDPTSAPAPSSSPSPPSSPTPSGPPPPPNGPRLVAAGGNQPSGRRRILFQPPLAPVVAATLDALSQYHQAHPSIFMRGNQLTEVGGDEQGRLHLRLIREDSLIAHLDRAIQYYVFRDGSSVNIFPPRLIVTQLLSRPADQLPFPPLINIVRSPIMRANGTVLERATPGYDDATHYYCAMDSGVASLGVPSAPSAAELATAVELLRKTLRDFRFANPANVYFANYVGLLLTPLVRLMVDDNVPLFAVNGTKAGAGKGLLAKILGILATGREATTTTAPAPAEGGEWRKKITTFLLSGETIIVVDNVVDSLNSPELCAMTTTRNYSDRVLGGNTSMSADPANAIWIFTGNGLQPKADLLRRCVWICLDPQCSDPQRRTDIAEPNLPKWVSDNRAPLLRALFTLVRAWVVAGQPAPQGIGPFGSFDRWLNVVGGILQNAGLTEFFRDPEKAYTDPDAEQWIPFLRAIGEVTYWDEFTIADLAKTAHDVQYVSGRTLPSQNAAKLRDNLSEELAKVVDSEQFRTKLTSAFRRKKNTYYGSENIHIAHTGKETRDGAGLWQVRKGIPANAGAAPSAAAPAASSSAPSSSSSSTATLRAPPSSSASTTFASPVQGEVRYRSGTAYVFDGQKQKWVKRP